MRLLVLAALAALLFPLSTGSQDGGDLVNAVMGNATAQHLPPHASETLRIQMHLLSVAERLWAVNARGLTPEQHTARARNIARLMHYACAGRFPDSPAGMPGRVPNFLCDDGTVCAVGYLVEQDLGIDAVREIARHHQFDYVPYIDSPMLSAWQQASGLAPLELAMIQPTYGPRPTVENARKRLEEVMRRLEQQGFAGQVVVTNGRTTLLDGAFGYADSTKHVMVNRETGFDIASVTKAFTAAAILRLANDKRLRLKDTVGDLFPDAPFDKQKITIKQLLGHKSGMGSTYAADGETDRTRAVAKLLAQPLAGLPGKNFLYSDDGYVVLAAIIEVTSGSSYEQYLQNTVIDSDYMMDTTFWGWDSPLADFSRPLDETLTRPQWGQRGSGGIISTARDLSWWTLRFMEGSVVSNPDELTAPRERLADDVWAGYGWFRTRADTDQGVLWTRGNEDFGHNALIAVYTWTQNVLVVTSNRFSGEEPWSRRVQRELEPLLLPR